MKNGAGSSSRPVFYGSAGRLALATQRQKRHFGRSACSGLWPVKTLIPKARFLPNIKLSPPKVLKGNQHSSLSLNLWHGQGKVNDYKKVKRRLGTCQWLILVKMPIPYPKCLQKATLKSSTCGLSYCPTYHTPVNMLLPPSKGDTWLPWTFYLSATFHRMAWTESFQDGIIPWPVHSACLGGQFTVPSCLARFQFHFMRAVFGTVSLNSAGAVFLWATEKCKQILQFWRHCLGISSLFCSPGPASMCQKQTGSDKAASQRQGLSYQQCDCLSKMRRRKSWHFDVPGKPDKVHRGLRLPAIVIH